MTILIDDVAPRAHYVATHGQTLFAVPFEWISNTDLKVWVNEVLCTFDAPPLDAMHYSTTGQNTEGGGSISFGAPGRLAGDRVIIIRDMSIDSPADFPTTGVFPVASLNAAFDEMTAGIQQAEINVQQRALRMADNDFLQAINPIPMVGERAGKLLGFDADGHPTVGGSINGDGGGSGGSGGAARVWTDDVPPPLPWHDGDLWWESDSGKLFVFYEDGDSGQWVEASASASGGGSSNVITPQMFGALGDGVADEAVQVQQAIDAGIAQGRPVYLRGTFLTGSASLLVSGPLVIDGRSGTINCPDQISVFRITSSNVSIDGLTITGGGNASLDYDGKLINAYGFANGVGIAPTTISNIRITNCMLSQAGGFGIFMNYVQAFEISGNIVSACGYSGIQLDSCHIGEVIRNSVSDIAPGTPTLSYGIALGSVNSSDLVRYPTCTRITVDHNRIVNVSWEGLDCHGGDRLSFSFNYLRACGATNAAISIAHRDDGGGPDTSPIDPATNVRIIGNIIREAREWAISTSSGNPTGAGSGSITHEGFVIANNLIEDAGDLTKDPAVATTGGFRIMAVRGCSITGNSFKRVSPYGVFVGSTKSDGISIVGNSFIDVISNAYNNPTAIQVSRGTNSNVISIVGNSISAGGAAATYKNVNGVRPGDTPADTGKFSIGVNAFQSASLPYLVNTSQPNQIMGGGEPVTNLGINSVPVTTGSPTGTLLLTLANAHTSNARWFATATVSSAPSNAPTIVEVVRTSVTQITLNVRTANGANFPASGSVIVSWRTGGF